MSLPILWMSAKKVGVTNGNTCKGKYVTLLPSPQLSKKATEADTFKDFPTSVRKTADDCNISIFTKEGIAVYREEDILITCKGAAILSGKQDKHGQYKILLTQN